ncbi:MAG: DHH family phosphoesterase [archaeon]
MEVKEAALKFKKIIEKPGIIRVVTHLDTDGMSSAAILIHALRKLDQQFCVMTVRQLEDSIIEKLVDESKKWKAIMFLDLGSPKLGAIAKLSQKIPVFVLDHHPLERGFKPISEIVGDLIFVNPLIEENAEDNVSASSVVYEFVKEIDSNNKNLAQLAVLGMIGDMADKVISKTNTKIVEEAKEFGMQVKRGLIIFSSTRPLHKALELSSSIFIPGVTGCQNGAFSLLRELDIKSREGAKWKTLLDLDKNEMSRLLTAILLRRINTGRDQNILGNIYLLKLNGRLQDVRELSTTINACGRLGHSSLAISYLLGSLDAGEKVQRIYTEYKHHLIKGLKWVEAEKKIVGDNYVIINVKDNIKDTIVGTVISILANSFIYPAGTVMVGMAYRTDGKIKVSSRIAGPEDSDINLYHLLDSVIQQIGGEVGGHPRAAGALISQKKEQEFLEVLERALKIEEIKIKV